MNWAKRESDTGDVAHGSGVKGVLLVEIWHGRDVSWVGLATG